MTEEEIVELVRQTLMLSLQISAPIMLVGLVVGTIIALIQALTQVQEQTLVFVPKMFAVFFAMIVGLPMMNSALITFMQFLADKIIAIK